MKKGYNKPLIKINEINEKEDILSKIESTALYTKYIFGELHADFLDDDDFEEDDYDDFEDEEFLDDDFEEESYDDYDEDSLYDIDESDEDYDDYD